METVRAQLNQREDTNSLRHPLHDLVDLINKTPADMIKLKFEQAEDGSKKFMIDIPSRAEQAKQKAMEEAMRQQGQGSGMIEAKPEVNEMMSNTPAGNVSKMPPSSAPSTPSAAAAAVKNVQVRVAMSPEQAAKELKSQFPAGFLKSMGL